MAAILKFRRGATVSGLVQAEPFLETTNDTFNIGTDDVGGYITLAKLNESQTADLILVGNLSASNAYFTGNVDLDGNLFIGGDITLGGGGDDTIFVGAPLSGSLIPISGSVYDLGSIAKPWGTVYANSAIITDLTASYVDYTDIDNLPTLVSGSSQINHNTTNNYVSDQHIDHSSLSITSGLGIIGGGVLTVSRELTLDTGSVHFTSGVKTKLNIETVVSGSSQVSFNGITDKPTLVSGSSQISYPDLSNIPGGIISSSAQVDADTITNFDTNVKDKLNVEGVISGSSQLDSVFLEINGDSVISGSSQIDVNDTQNFTPFSSSVDSRIDVLEITSESLDSTYEEKSSTSHTLISGSSQVNADTITNFDTNVKTKLDAETVISGSSQIDVNDTQNFTPFSSSVDSRIELLEGSSGSLEDVFEEKSSTSHTLISGSSQVNADSITNFDTNVKDKLDEETVISGSIQVNHNQTTDYTASRHIDHTTISISSGNGLSGGGTIDGNQTLTLDSGSVHFKSGSIQLLDSKGIVSQSLLNTLTTDEINQLININSVTISNTQWGYLGNLNQELSNDSNVTFKTGSFSGNLIVAGDLTVLGDATTINTSELIIEDKLITVASGSTNSAEADGGGIEIAGANASMKWNDASDSMVFDTKVSSSVGFKGDGSELTGVTAGDVEYSNILNLPTLVSGSTQIDVTNTTNFSSINQYSDAKVKLKLDADSVISSSIQVDYIGLSNIPGGIVSGSSQVNADSITNFDTNVKDKLNAETVISGSSQIDVNDTQNFTPFSSSVDSRIDLQESFSSSIDNIFEEKSSTSHTLISGSSQVDADTITNFDINVKDKLNSDGVISGSSQVDLTQTTNYISGIKTRLNLETVISGSSQLTSSFLEINGDSVVSGSSQIDVNNTQNFTSFSSSVDSRFSTSNLSSSLETIFEEKSSTSHTLISGSSQVDADTITNFDINVKDKLDNDNVVSGSSQISFIGITDKPTLVSGSSQISYTGIINISSNIVSGSSQLTSSFDLLYASSQSLYLLTSSLGTAAYYNVSASVGPDPNSVPTNQAVENALIAAGAGDITSVNADNAGYGDLGLYHTQQGTSDGGAYGLTGTTVIALDTGSVRFTEGIKKKLDTDGVLSGSGDFLLPLNNFTESIQIEVDTISAETSSYLKNTTDTLDGDLTVTGLITALEFHTQLISSSIIYESGSTKFGDTPDDTHEFTGSVEIDGDITLNNTDLVGVRGIDFISGSTITWNTEDHTLNIPTGFGTTIQVGQELVVHVHNNTTGSFLDGKVVYPIGTSTNGLPDIGYAISNTHETISGQVGLVTGTITAGSEGFVTIIGKVRDIDTSGLSGPVYISPTVAGDLTSTKPQFPDYDILMGVALDISPSGSVVVDIRGTAIDTLQNFHNGTFRETFDFLITSDGVNVTGSLSPANGHPDMTMMFSDGFTMLTATPDADIILTAGTDTNPQVNYIYVLKSTKVLTVNTSDWPTVEHIKVAEILLQSAATTLTNGALLNQNHNDHIEDTLNFQGHLSHITERIRSIGSNWHNGVEASVTINSGPTPDDVFVAVTSGNIYQLHKQAFPALDLETGDDIHIVNHNTTPYQTVTNLNTQILDSQGVALNNTSFSFVIWGVINKTGQTSHLMLNLPTNSYGFTAPSDAINDALNYSVYTIPGAFAVVGFLIARLTFTYKNDVWTLEDTEDLRGSQPNSSAGGGVGGVGITTALGLTDTPSVYTANYFWQVNSGATATDFVDINPVIKLKLDADGVISGSSQLDTVFLEINGDSVVSGSSQINYPDISNIPANIVSGSSQLDNTSITNLTLTGDTIIISASLTYDENLDVDLAAPEVIALVSTASYDGVFFDYVAKQGTNVRAGIIMAAHDGTNVVYTDNSTTDLGDTSPIVMSVDILTGNMRLVATTTTDNWIVKTLIRKI